MSGDLVDQERARLLRGVGERGVPGREENVVGVDRQRGCEVGGVIATQRVPGGEVSGVPRERLVKTDDAQLRVELLQRLDGEVVCGLVDPIGSSSGRDARAGFRIDELAGDRKLGAVP
jgi:hypothetical protein